MDLILLFIPSTAPLETRCLVHAAPLSAEPTTQEPVSVTSFAFSLASGAHCFKASTSDSSRIACHARGRRLTCVICTGQRQLWGIVSLPGPHSLGDRLGRA